MLKKKITYTDYNGQTRTEEFHFNLSKAELMQMAASENGGFDIFIEKIIAERDVTRMAALFKELILKAYGEKSIDGKHFVKSPDLSEAFSQTEAFSDLYVELSLDSKAASEFVNGIMPADFDKLLAQIEEKSKAAAAS